MSKNARKLEITFDHKITISILYRQEKYRNFSSKHKKIFYQEIYKILMSKI